MFSASTELSGLEETSFNYICSSALNSEWPKSCKIGTPLFFTSSYFVFLSSRENLVLWQVNINPLNLFSRYAESMRKLAHFRTPAKSCRLSQVFRPEKRAK